jgi:dihydrofolate reductase
LPGRDNLVISRNTDFQIGGCRVFGDIASALHEVANSPEVFVIGGATLYQEMLAGADYLYLTLINKTFVGDTFFPEIDFDQWREISREDITNDQSVDFTYSFLKLKNVGRRHLNR